jgi:hypothetical protein
MRAILLALMPTILLINGGAAFAQTVKELDITFRTTGDDKDGDTQVRDRIVVNGTDYASLICCSAGKNSSDHWDDNSDQTRTMTIVKPITKVQLHSARFVVGSTANGNDCWIFVPTLKVTYQDNSSEQWTFAQTTLNSTNSSLVEVTYSIPPR